MHPYPHLYVVSAAAGPEGDVPLDSPRLPTLLSAPPAEFDGPGDRWSPETLLVAAVANCFVLTFRGVARAQKIAWTSLGCEVTGTLDRVEGRTRFTRYRIKAWLVAPAGFDEEKCRRALERSEQVCLITNSLNGELELESSVTAG